MAVLLRAEGMHPKDVASTLGVARRSVERWVKAYRSGGVEGLKPRPRLGKPRMTQDRGRAIAETALKSPRAFGYPKDG